MHRPERGRGWILVGVLACSVYLLFAVLADAAPKPAGGSVAARGGALSAVHADAGWGGWLDVHWQASCPPSGQSWYVSYAVTDQFGHVPQTSGTSPAGGAKNIIGEDSASGEFETFAYMKPGLEHETFHETVTIDCFDPTAIDATHPDGQLRMTTIGGASFTLYRGPVPPSLVVAVTTSEHSGNVAAGATAYVITKVTDEGGPVSAVSLGLDLKGAAFKQASHPVGLSGFSLAKGASRSFVFKVQAAKSGLTTFVATAKGKTGDGKIVTGSDSTKLRVEGMYSLTVHVDYKDGKPAAGVQVELNEPSTSMTEKGVTGTNGDFGSFFEPGLVKIALTAPKGESALKDFSPSEEGTADLSDSDQTVRFVFEVNRLTVHVRYPNASPASGVPVVLYQPGDETLAGVTDSHGDFTGSLMPGPVEISVKAPNEIPTTTTTFSPSDTGTADLTHGDQTKIFTLNAAHLEVAVDYPDGTPAPNVRVYVQESGGEETKGLTDSNGTYSGAFEPGMVEVTLETPAGHNPPGSFKPESEIVDLKGGTGSAVFVYEAKRLTVHVTYPDGKPASGVRVHLTQFHTLVGYVTGVTNRKGDFEGWFEPAEVQIILEAPNGDTTPGKFSPSFQGTADLARGNKTVDFVLNAVK
jgi:5-hydroxyisourate hydrolase-like protein (transthyretin family)